MSNCKHLRALTLGGLVREGNAVTWCVDCGAYSQQVLSEAYKKFTKNKQTLSSSPPIIYTWSDWFSPESAYK